MIEEMLDTIERSIEDVKRKFYGVATGTVSDVEDPLMLGRVKVRLESIDASDSLPWARVAVPFAGLLSGHYFIPGVGDTVLVAFEHGDVNAPYVIGSLWTAMAPPPLTSPTAEIRVIRTLAGNQIAIGERPPTITVQTGPTPAAQIPSPASPTASYHTIELGSAGITATTATKIALEVGTTSITIEPTSITLRVGGNTIAMSSSGIEITATGQLEIKASGVCTVQGSLVKIN
jgi:phage baseplate assembly protein gpV